jgi:hypothetical protein
MFLEDGISHVHDTFNNIKNISLTKELLDYTKYEYQKDPIFEIFNIFFHLLYLSISIKSSILKGGGSELYKSIHKFFILCCKFTISFLILSGHDIRG